MKCYCGLSCNSSFQLHKCTQNIGFYSQINAIISEKFVPLSYYTYYQIEACVES
jgi:hypothetical protein